MYIKNITDVSNDKIKPRVIGIHKDISLNPGEEKYIPDELVYIDEVDSFGRPTGKKSVLPALRAQERIGLIAIREELRKPGGRRAPAPAPAEPTPNGDADDTPAAPENDERELTPSEKRARTRAANAAAKAAADTADE